MNAYVEVLGVNIAVLWQIEIFLCHQHALTEEVLVDLLSVRLGDKPVAFDLVCVLWVWSQMAYIAASSWRASGNRTQRGRY